MTRDEAIRLVELLIPEAQIVPDSAVDPVHGPESAFHCIGVCAVLEVVRKFAEPEFSRQEIDAIAGTIARDIQQREEAAERERQRLDAESRKLPTTPWNP